MWQLPIESRPLPRHPSLVGIVAYHVPDEGREVRKVDRGVELVSDHQLSRAGEAMPLSCAPQALEEVLEKALHGTPIGVLVVLPRIEIAVPPLVSEASFALAQERLIANKRFASRRTIEPSLLQGLVSCKKCGYALYRTSTRTSARTGGAPRA